MESFNDVQKICLEVFETVSKTTSIFVLPLFMGQIAFANVSGEGSKAFQALKGVLVYFCLIAGFPLILDILFSIPQSYLPKFKSVAELTDQVSNSSYQGLVPLVIDRALEVVLSTLYWIVYYFHIFFMLIMCSMAPIVFLGGTVLGIGLGLEIFMGLLIIGSSWPIIWYGFDQIHANLSSVQDDAFGSKCLELLITVLKGIAPVAFAQAAIRSPAGKLVNGAALGAISTVPKPTFGRKFEPATFNPSANGTQGGKSSTPPTSDIVKRYVTRTNPKRTLGDRLQSAKENVLKMTSGGKRESARQRNHKA